MSHWWISQITNFNLISFITIIVIVTVMGKSNTTKLLKEQSQEIYAEIEELKQEIRGNTDKIVDMLKK